MIYTLLDEIARGFDKGRRKGKKEIVIRLLIISRYWILSILVFVFEFVALMSFFTPLGVEAISRVEFHNKSSNQLKAIPIQRLAFRPRISTLRYLIMT